MRIINLYSENIKRVKAVDITPKENVVILSGKNGEGKTSVLDSIWFAIQYRGASKNNPIPLRSGTDKGIVTVDLGDYIVTRKFTPAGTTLEVKTPDGSKIPSPQGLLDGLIGDLSFDPWDFSRKKESEQREMLTDVLYTVTNGKVDLADFDARHKQAFDKRTEENKEKRRLTTLLTQLSPPTQQDPTEEISILDLTKAISDGIVVQGRTQQLVSRKLALSDKIVQLETELKKARTEHDDIINQLEDVPECPDIEFLKGELANIEQRNKRAREVIDYQKIRASLTVVDTDIKNLNDTMELIEIEKAEALENSPLPVKGLRVTPDGIMVINEENKLVPFCQASAAQRLRISLGIAMAANPKLRVIRISDGSLLDDTSMCIVREMANTDDFQVWIEYASRNDTDRMGVYIEDGSVAPAAVSP